MIHPVELNIEALGADGMQAPCRLVSNTLGGNSGLRPRLGSAPDGETTAERFAVLPDPTDSYMIYDEFRDEPAAIGGHVLIGLSHAWAIALGRRLNDLAAAGAFARQP